MKILDDKTCTYSVTVQFTTPYLQARFNENAKAELENLISKGVVKSDEDSWATLIYRDDNGVYIPSQHFRESFVLSGKEFKLKSQRRSMQQWVISSLIVSPGRIYLGKMEPDEVVTSYPARKDGMRVTLRHPSFNIGTKVSFELTSLDCNMEAVAIENVVRMAGKMYGVGAWRRGLHGRFKVIEFKKKI